MKKAAGIGDAAVQKKTGKTWAEWFAVLDKAGARKMNHTDIAALLHGKHGCGAWWSQMVAVGYEQDRGLREKHERPNGFEIGRSRTIAASLSKVYAAWKDKKARSRWLMDFDFVVRKAIANKSMRITWVDKKTSVEVLFYAKGLGKTQVAVQHSKLADTNEAERKKVYWEQQLVQLSKVFEA